MTANPSTTSVANDTLAQEVRAIRPRRRVPLAMQIISRDGSKVRSRFRDGGLDHLLTRRGALEGGRAILQVMRRERHRRDARRRGVVSYARALIAVAKSIPADDKAGGAK